MSDEREWTNEERASLAKAAPELAGSTRGEVMRLIQRYGTSIPALQDLVAGRPTRAAIVEALNEKDEQAARARYPATKW